jgi:poly(beta-D-mannuronate) lyase
MRRLFIVAFTLAVFATSPMAHAESVACPSFAPVAKVGGVNIYVDQRGAGSIPDRAREQQTANAQQTILSFLSYLEGTVDGTNSALDAQQQGCLRGLLDRWAGAHALMLPPDAATPRVDRIFFSIALNVVALKQRWRGMKVDPTELSWLRNLTTAVTRDYGRDTLRGTPFFRNNTYFWAAVAAGTYSLLADDTTLFQFQDVAWSDDLALVRDDGTLAAELYRGRRALIYHMSSLGALFMLKDVRSALGLPITAQDLARLNRLATAVGRTLCDPSWMAVRAKVKDQERPGEWGFRVISAYNSDVADHQWLKCGMVLPNPAEIRVGGNMQDMRRAINVAARQH